MIKTDGKPTIAWAEPHACETCRPKPVDPPQLKTVDELIDEVLGKR